MRLVTTVSFFAVIAAGPLAAQADRQGPGLQDQPTYERPPDFSKIGGSAPRAPVGFRGLQSQQPRRPNVQHPVLSRVKAVSYGRESGSGNFNLRVEAGSDSAMRTAIKVRGGRPGLTAGILVGSGRLDASIGRGARLLVNPVFPAFGAFDRNSDFTCVVDLTRRDLIGRTWYLQGFATALTEGPEQVFRFSAGVEVSFVAAKAQPVLTWRGPKLTALLARNQIKPFRTSYHLNLRVDCPTAGWQLHRDEVQNAGATTRVFLSLEAPTGGARAVLTSERQVCDLGTGAGTKVEVWLRVSPQGAPRDQPAYDLAAVLERDF